jgi:hypothetical protein
VHIQKTPKRKTGRVDLRSKEK